MVFKYFGTWNEVLNHFENLLIKKWTLRFLLDDYDTVSFGKVYVSKNTITYYFHGREVGFTDRWFATMS